MKDPIPMGVPSIAIPGAEKRCERCGRVIPTNKAYATGPDGKVLMEGRNQAIRIKNARLICECWAEIKVPVAPKKPRARRGKPVPVDPRQLTIDAPMERIK